MSERTNIRVINSANDGSSHEPVVDEIVDLGEEMFKAADGTVISYQGENYYRACGEFVSFLEDGGRSSCVLPARFPHEVHSDYRGTTTEGKDDVFVSLTALPRDQEELESVSRSLCRAFEVLTSQGIRTTISMIPGGDDSSTN